MNRSVLAAVVTAGVVGFPATAPAHKLEVVAKLPPDAPAVLRVEVGYDDDTPAEGAKVTLTDRAGAVVATGTTDERGVCTLVRPAAGGYTLTADDGAGHRATLPLEVGGPDGGPTRNKPQVPFTLVGLAVIVGGTLFLWWLARSRR
ncbi:MAG: hypothetical protein U0871_14415 [Gemmataceae bacterium]